MARYAPDFPARISAGLGTQRWGPVLQKADIYDRWGRGIVWYVRTRVRGDNVERQISAFALTFTFNFQVEDSLLLALLYFLKVWIFAIA